MNKKLIDKHIDKAIYTISEEIVPRRKSVIMPVIASVAGLAMLIYSSSLNKVDGNENLASSTFFFGLTVLIVGFVMIVIRLMRKEGFPYYLPSRCRMNERVNYFDATKRNLIMELFNNNNLDELDKLSSENPSPLMMISYRTDDDKVTVMQIHEYVPHRYVPISETIIHKK